MEEVRLGTIGSGVIVHSILNNVMKTEGIRLTAVYSRTEEKGRALADEYGAEKVFTDLDAFFASDETNTVYIASPNLLHYGQVKKALLAGKHVICEKPFVTKASQAEELINLAKEKKLLLVEAAPTTFMPNYADLKKAVGRIGQIRLVMGNYSQYSSRYDLLKKGEVPNIFNPEFAGGCLMDINFYNVYLCVALFGEPVSAVYNPNIFGSLADTSGVMTMQYDGFVSMLAGAKDTWGVNFFQIEGDEGYVYVKDGPNGIAEVRIVTRTSEETVNLQSNPDRWFYEVQELTRLYRAEDYDAVYSRLDTTLGTVKVIEKARLAAGIRFPGDE